METYWQSKKAELGNVRMNTNKEVVFHALLGIPDIINIKTECGCTSAKFDAKERVLKVTYKAGNIPKHIPGNQVVLKKIIIIYRGGASEILEISGTKVR